MKKGEIKRIISMSILAVILVVSVALATIVYTGGFDVPSDSYRVETGDDGLIGYWSFDEGSAVDYSGNGNDGTVSGAVYSSDGYRKGGMEFDGENQTVSVPDSASIDIDTNAFTIEAWFKPDIDVLNMSADYPILAIKRPWEVGGYTAHFIKSIGTINVQYCFSGSCPEIASTTIFKADIWYHYIGTFDGQELRLYINGELENSAEYNETMGSSTGENLEIGKNFEGVIDEVRIYNRSLSSDEVYEHFKDKVGVYLNKTVQTEAYACDENTVALWHFDGSASDSCGDNDGTLMDSGELVINGGAEFENTEGWINFDGISSIDKHSGDYSFYEEGYNNIYSDYFIPIDINKTYYLNGWFKSYGIENSKLYFGYIPYDENKVQIHNEHVNVRLNTETTLYEGCSSTDKIVKIVDGANWATYSYGTIAFEIDDSGNYNDLPNRKLSNRNITRVENKGTYWEIEFDTSVGKTYPAGTKIREHWDGLYYMYVAAGGDLVPTTWTEYSDVGGIQGENVYGTNISKWWLGTKYARVIVRANYDQSSDYKLRVDDVSWTSSPASYIGPELVDGKFGNGYEFNGIDDYVNMGNNANFDITNEISVESWVYPQTQDSKYNGIVSKSQNNSNGWELRTTSYTSTTTNVQFRLNGDVGSTSSFTLQNDNWYHLAGTFDGYFSKLYVNGILKKSKNYDSSILTNTFNLQIGKLAYASLFFKGTIDEVRISNVARTPDEIYENYQQGLYSHSNEIDGGGASGMAEYRMEF